MVKALVQDKMEKNSIQVGELTPSAKAEAMQEKHHVTLIDLSFTEFQNLYEQILAEQAPLQEHLKKLWSLSLHPILHDGQVPQKMPDMTPVLEPLSDTLHSLEYIYDLPNILPTIINLLEMGQHRAREHKPDAVFELRTLAHSIFKQLLHEARRNYMTEQEFYTEAMKRRVLAASPLVKSMLSKKLGSNVVEEYFEKVLPAFHVQKVHERHGIPTEHPQTAEKEFLGGIKDLVQVNNLESQIKAPSLAHLLSLVRELPITVSASMSEESFEDRTHSETERLWNSPEVKSAFDDLYPLFREALTYRKRFKRQSNILNVFAAMRTLLERVHHMTDQEQEKFPKVYLDMYHQKNLGRKNLGNLSFDMDAYDVIEEIRPNEGENTLFKELLEPIDDLEGNNDYALQNDQLLMKMMLRTIVAEKLSAKL